MVKQNNYNMKAITYYLLAGCFIGLLSSCSENVSTLKAPKLEDSAFTSTRAVKKKVAAKAYYYRTLLSVVNGSITSTAVDDNTPNTGDVNLVLLYEANAPWANVFDNADLTDATADLNKLLKSHNLQIVKQFSIDHNNMGLVLEPKDPNGDPVEIARNLSMLKHVLVVNIKQVPEEDAFYTEEK